MDYLSRRFVMQGAASRRVVKPGARGSLYSVAMHAFLPAQLPVLPASSVADSPLRTWFKDGGVLICRPFPNTSPFAVALKGGHNAEHHNHNDVGTFMVVSGKSMVLCDPGAEVYTARTFSSRRYDSDVLNSFGHPVPVIAGELQRTGIQAKGKVLRTEFSDAQDIIELDITSAYAVPSLKLYQRTFTYVRQPKPSLTVSDKVEFDSPQTFETALVTWGRWQRNAQDLVITDEGGAVQVKVETADQPYQLKSKRLQADVGNANHAERLGIALSSPAKTALIKLIITPASGK